MTQFKSNISSFRWLLTALTVLSLTACDEIKHYLSGSDDYAFLTSFLAKDTIPQMEVVGVEFAPDYKTFTVSTKMQTDGIPYQLEDSTRVRTQVEETIDGIRYTRYSTPQLIKMRNVEAEGVIENDVRILLLVDRSMPQAELNKVRTYVSEIRTVFDHDNLFVAFMDGETVGKTMLLTDYVLDAYFRQSAKDYVYLYRSMQTKVDEIMQGKDLWKGAKRRVMITFSDDRVYNDDLDTPIDPDHYRYVERLVRRPRSTGDTTFLAYYVSMNPQPMNEDDYTQNIPWLFCNNYCGAYMKDFDWTTTKRMIYASFHFTFPDNEFVFMNPDFKVYRGDVKQLTLNFYDVQTGKIVTSFTTNVQLGQLYRPIIVRGHGIMYVLVQGGLLTIFLLLLVYLVMQVIIPVIRYLIFRHKYVIEYTGANMSFEGKAVGDTCYLCKAPFQAGDKIVVKCEHTMHESCWEENDYHCPEYSDRCQHGSHYFNSYNLFDIRNASFYMKWILIAIVAAALSWLCFSLYMYLHIDDAFMQHFMRPPISQTPFVGGVCGFFLTLGLSLFTVATHGWRKWMQVLVRALVAAFACYATILLVNAIILAFDIESGIMFLNGLPWIASCFIIALCATYATRVVYKRRMVLYSILLGIISMAIWVLFYQRAELDFRVLLLFSFIIFSVGMAVSIATIAPRSERYFLKVQGAVKEMDVALYKWFRNNPERVVTIGKSVDCSLQLSWDIQRAVAPVQAEIRMIHKAPYLIALESGVFINNRPLKVDRKVRLFHGRTFVIGQTTFTYIEKDR